MDVSLISYTPDALNLLLRTKNTRLAYDSPPESWSAEKRAQHLAYMLETVKSSWEFVDYVFDIRGVSRAFTHQLVRTRTGSYAQEAQRVIDARDNGVIEPHGLYSKYSAEAIAAWARFRDEALANYAALLDEYGFAPQDARSLLPTNVSTSIMAKFNLRTLHEMAKVRLCTRTQGEYQAVFRSMREAVIDVHPWAEPFIHVACVQDGTCAFPAYGRKSCPVWHNGLDRSDVKQYSSARFAFYGDHEANPTARDGRAVDATQGEGDEG